MLERCQVTFSREGRRVLVALRGTLDAQGADQLHPLLVDVIDGQGNVDVVVDWAGLELLDRQCVGVLADACRRAAEKRRGAGVVVPCSGQVSPGPFPCPGQPGRAGAAPGGPCALATLDALLASRDRRAADVSQGRAE